MPTKQVFNPLTGNFDLINDQVFGIAVEDNGTPIS